MSCQRHETTAAIGLRDWHGHSVEVPGLAITSPANASAHVQLGVQTFAKAWGVVYKPRLGRSVQQFFASEADVRYLGVLERPGSIRLYTAGQQEPFFYHPGVALLRIKQLVRGDLDRLVQVAGVRAGDSILDCTAGLCADAVVLSYAVGSAGSCVALEISPVVAFVVAVALRHYRSGYAPFDDAMRRVDLRCVSWREALPTASYKAFDILYFDPMFTGTSVASPGILPLRMHAQPGGISVGEFATAQKIARRGVVVKDVRPGPLLQALNMEPVRRTGQSTWYGFAPV